MRDIAARRGGNVARRVRRVSWGAPSNLRRMATPNPGAATGLVLALEQGEQRTIDELLPLVYGELRRLAQGYMSRERTDHTLSTTALVHEAYLRLVDQSRVEWKDRSHFLGVAAIAMRRILIEYARRRNTAKRDGERHRVSLSDISLAQEESADTLLALNDALERLAVLSPRLVRVVECRYFLGLSDEETAGALGVTTRTVRRDWIKAKGWLAEALDGGAP
ncbi:MAG: ECF-type sigma factor [Gemmatimonadaceae bacterium]